MSESDLFVLYYLTVLVYTKTILHFSIGGLGKIFPLLLLDWVNIHFSHLHYGQYLLNVIFHRQSCVCSYWKML